MSKIVENENVLLRANYTIIRRECSGVERKVHWLGDQNDLCSPIGPATLIAVWP